MAAPAPQAPAAASYIPIVTDFLRLVRVLYEPSKVFEEQREKPTWFLPWLVIAILCMVIGFLQLPYTARTVELMMQAYPNAPQLTPAQLHSRAMIGVFVTPIVFLIFAFVGAGILFLIVSVTGSSARYRGMLSATVFAQVMLPITLLLQALILRMRGSPSEAITAVADAQPALGLNVLISGEGSSHFVQAILAGIGPLPIWSVIITAIGIMHLEKAKKSSAWTAAIVSYLLMLLIGAGLAGLQK
ncbi:MAG TPA: YIP1 family protein [Gemmatimonadales bacterium]|nr:YIP1 family protein [Gemmatimonadales bacterium]